MIFSYFVITAIVVLFTIWLTYILVTEYKCRTVPLSKLMKIVTEDNVDEKLREVFQQLDTKINHIEFGEFTVVVDDVFFHGCEVAGWGLPQEYRELSPYIKPETRRVFRQFCLDNNPDMFNNKNLMGNMNSFNK